MGTPVSDRPRLTVVALTYRRNGDLDELVPQLGDQLVAVTDRVSRARIVIVDNDPAAGARECTMELAASCPAPVVYVHEAEPGIAAARNRALAESGDDDLLVFIDDDERPHPGWLERLLEAYELNGRPAAVFGPVISVFDEEPGPWVTAGDFFRRRRLRTGTQIEVGATNNVLLDLHQIRAMGLTFDAGLGISGGSDTLFTKQIRAAGGQMVWCDEAVVDDRVPAARVTREWVLRRAMRSGNSWSRTTLMSGRDSLVDRARLSAAGTVRLLGGAARLVLGTLTRSQPHQARGARSAARGLGMVLGAWGYSYQEYRRSA